MAVTAPDFLFEDSTITQVESLSVLRKCCDQDKTQWTFTPLKNAKIQTKTHKMEVSEESEHELVESHA
jgi:hypothetical protein